MSTVHVPVSNCWSQISFKLSAKARQLRESHVIKTTVILHNININIELIQWGTCVSNNNWYTKLNLEFETFSDSPSKPKLNYKIKTKFSLPITAIVKRASNQTLPGALSFPTLFKSTNWHNLKTIDFEFKVQCKSQLEFKDGIHNVCKNKLLYLNQVNGLRFKLKRVDSASHPPPRKRRKVDEADENGSVALGLDEDRENDKNQYICINKDLASIESIYIQRYMHSDLVQDSDKDEIVLDNPLEFRNDHNKLQRVELKLMDLKRLSHFISFGVVKNVHLLHPSNILALNALAEYLQIQSLKKYLNPMKKPKSID